MIFNRNIKDFNRVVEIIQVFHKYRLEEVIFIFQLRTLVPKERKIRWQKGPDSMHKYTLWQRIRMAFEELGPAFVKLGQVLSNRKDILPDDLVAEFEKLQSSVAPFEYEKVKAIVERESGKPLEKTFKHFNTKPLASASIGQAHKAVLNSGEQVVVKIQRPGIKPVIERDLSVLKRSVRLAQSTLEKRFGLSNLMDFIEEFEKTMYKELSYANEARNIRQFKQYYANFKGLYIPDVFKELSTDKILVMEFAPGCKITDVDQLKAWGLKPEKIAEKGMEIYVSQMFEHGYFHADPHPGNIIIRQDGMICLIDFGMVGKLVKKDKSAFAQALISMARQDVSGMANNLRNLALSDEIVNRRVFESDISDIIEEYSTLEVSELNIAELGLDLQKLFYKHKMKVPASLFLLLRALAILEGIGKTIHPTFNSYEFIKPYGRKLAMEKFSKENITQEILYRLHQFDYFIRNFPADLQEILRTTRKGKLHLEIEHQGYDSGLDKLIMALNRLIIAMIIVGLLISSSVVMLALSRSTGARLSEMPFLPIGGFILAGILALLLWWFGYRSSKK